MIHKHYTFILFVLQTFLAQNYCSARFFSSLDLSQAVHSFSCKTINKTWNLTLPPTAPLSQMLQFFCFVLQTFLAQKYGYRPFPPRIPADEFNSLLGAVKDSSDRQLLTDWFLLDENAVPAHYQLQPIRDKLPNYADDSDPDKKKEVSYSIYISSIGITAHNTKFGFLLTSH